MGVPVAVEEGEVVVVVVVLEVVVVFDVEDVLEVGSVLRFLGMYWIPVAGQSDVSPTVGGKEKRC